MQLFFKVLNYYQIKKNFNVKRELTTEFVMFLNTKSNTMLLLMGTFIGGISIKSWMRKIYRLQNNDDFWRGKKKAGERRNDAGSEERYKEGVSSLLPSYKKKNLNKMEKSYTSIG